ncbi:MAG: peptidoglycan synthetase [Saprospiraceae bacterium]|nr:peptidoglycan synthetase [Saprospiraceae bacterium]MBL0100011.1 peptidoglycan synthetase [Saprospiraceae bacterium]
MHNIALDLHAQGHHITGSDDEIYEPSLSRLKLAGIAPSTFGWFAENITQDIDIVILGMHAKADNPELLQAQNIGLTIYSYPEFVYHHSRNKKRVVIAGSHGKTTTTAMILHVLNKMGSDFDYLVGAQLVGFDRMVRLTEAPLIVIEGDEYLSSAMDRVPKIHHYKPHIAVITGIAWDHINVFPTFESYIDQFRIFMQTMQSGSLLIYYQKDEILSELVKEVHHLNVKSYDAFSLSVDKNVVFEGEEYPISVIGAHNLQNMHAAKMVCETLGVSKYDFFTAIADFTGANKRLQKVSENHGRLVYLDFAHAPSKVKATTEAFKDWFGKKKLLAVLELHTFSSLNEEFISQYKHSLGKADEAIVFYNEHTLKMKNMPALDETFLKKSFDHPNLKVFTDEKKLYAYLKNENESNILLMTSGNYNKMPLDL